MVEGESGAGHGAERSARCVWCSVAQGGSGAGLYVVQASVVQGECGAGPVWQASVLQVWCSGV